MVGSSDVAAACYEQGAGVLRASVFRRHAVMPTMCVVIEYRNRAPDKALWYRWRSIVDTAVMSNCDVTLKLVLMSPLMFDNTLQPLSRVS